MRPHPQIRLGAGRVELGEHRHPQLDVLALQATHPVAVVLAQTGEITILDADDVGVAQGEVDVERG